MKKLFRFFFLLLFSFILINISECVEANSIDKISMDIFVDNNGNAEVTEIWNCYTNSGTEVYHPYYNLGSSEIFNLRVSEGNTTYTTLNYWNTSGSLSSKAYKCGINEISNGLELCWGISKYGNHTYTVKYTISNFVSSLTDSQMIYWTLIPYDFSNSIGNVYIKIHTNFNISDTTDVWGYGNYGGTAYVYDGYIEMQSDGTLDSDEYMTILVKFPLDTFNTSNSLNHNFDYYYNRSQEGSRPYQYEGYTSSGNYENSKNRLYTTILPFMFYFSYFLIPFVFIIIRKVLGLGKVHDFKAKEVKLSKEIPYFRDIPCNGNLFRAYYIAYQYNILSKKTDILGAIILKWLKDSLIRIDKREKGSIFKKEDTVIILDEVDPSRITDPFERKLFDMMYKASIDGILENKEFERWCNKSYSRVLSWFDGIIKSEKNKLISEGLIYEESKFFSKIYHPTEELKAMAEELAGLKRYLLEYTLIPDREPIEVHLFEEYLVYAQMMGIAKKVAKDFKELYPDVIEQSHFDSYDNIIFINVYSNRGISAATSAKSRAESYSSGGGGFSSGGGGGGSFGGGGGRRWFPLKNFGLSMGTVRRLSMGTVLVGGLSMGTVLFDNFSKNIY